MGIGLGQLLGNRPSISSEIENALKYVLNNQELTTLEEDGSISYDSIQATLLGEAEDVGEQAQREGILGPADVAVDKCTASGEFAYYGNGMILESLGNFSSFRANTCVYSGKWMYEVTLHTSGIQQLGWCTISCPFTAEEGVGDAPDSYAYDGKRTRKWSVKSTPYGQTWAAGDVIGCCLDLQAGEMSFYRNGAPLGVAFSGIRALQHTQMAFFPAASISYAEKCELNYGGVPFLYPVADFQPLQQGPSPQESAFASHLTSCLARLARLAADPAIAAADSAAHPPISHPIPPLSSHSSGGGPHQQWGYIPGGHGIEPGSSSSSESVGGAGLGVANNFMADGLQQQQQQQKQQRQAVRGSLGWTDVLLLARSICEHLGPLLVGSFASPSSSQPMAVDGAPSTSSGVSPRSSQCAAYHVGGALVQILLELHGRGEPHAPGPTLLLVQLLHLTLPEEAFTQIARTLLECLAGRAASAPLKAEHFPYSAAYPWLSLVCCLIQLQPLRAAWLSHPDLQLVLERCLTRKPPSNDDLRTLLPTVWWPGCTEEGASKELMDEAMSKFSATLAKVESRQVCIVAWLAGRAATGLDPGAGEDALLTFLRGLVLHNRGATRDVPPPGLSDPTVLISMFSALLRLLWPVLAHTISLPAGDMFVKSTARGDADPSNDLARLGGIVSHLKREHPLSDSELDPLQLAPSELPPPEIAADIAAQPALRSCPGILWDTAPNNMMPGSGVTYDSGMLSAEGMGQQQGWLQGLHPCARVLLGGDAVSAAVDVIAGAGSQDECGPEWGLLARFKRAWVPELVNTALILYSWRVGLSLKMVNTISNNLTTSIQNLNDVEQQLARLEQQQQQQQQAQQGQQADQQQAAIEEDDWAPNIVSRRGGGLGTEADRRRGTLAPEQHWQESLKYLQEARTGLRTDVGTNMRYMRLLKAVFFSGWKREALLALSGWLSRGLSASTNRGYLLAYMPSVYMEVVMDVMTTLCKSKDEDLPQLLLRKPPPAAHAYKEPQGPQPMEISQGAWEEDAQHGSYAPALLDSVRLLVGVLADPRIAHPDAKEQLMATLAAMLNHRIILGAIQEVELHPGAGKGPRLVPMVVAAFDSEDWHPIANLLRRIIADHGFGRQGLHAGISIAEKKAGAVRAGSMEGKGPYPSPVLQGMLADSLQASNETAKRFLNRLFTTLGWALTEFSIAVADLWEAVNPAPPPPLPPAVAAAIGSTTARRPPPQHQMLTEQQQLRRASLMFELAITLLRVLEFVTTAVPHTFMTSEVNMGRLMEVLPFALSHFAAGPDARRLSLLLQQYGGSGDGGSTNPDGRTNTESSSTSLTSTTPGGGPSSSSSSSTTQGQASGISTTGQPATPAAAVGATGDSGAAADMAGAGSTPVPPAAAATPGAATPANPAAGALPGVLHSIAGGRGLILDTGLSPHLSEQLMAALPSGGGLNLGSGVMLRVVGASGAGGGLLGRERLLGGTPNARAALALATVDGASLVGPRGSALGGGQRMMERQILVNRVSRAAALAPTAGVLLSLWRAEKQQQHSRQQQPSPVTAPSFLSSLVSSSGVALLADELAYMRRVDWRAAGLDGPTLEDDVQAFGQLCVEVEEHTRATEAAEGAAGVPEPPEDFVDPITAAVMTDPVTLPDSQVTLDRSTVERHLLSQATDPFSRKPLSIEMVVPNTELTARIQRWRATGGRSEEEDMA